MSFRKEARAENKRCRMSGGTEAAEKEMQKGKESIASKGLKPSKAPKRSKSTIFEGTSQGTPAEKPAASDGKSTAVKARPKKPDPVPEEGEPKQDEPKRKRVHKVKQEDTPQSTPSPDTKTLSSTTTPGSGSGAEERTTKGSATGVKKQKTSNEFSAVMEALKRKNTSELGGLRMPRRAIM